MIFESVYKMGYEAGYNARCLEDHEDQNRRLEDMLHHGKEIGQNEGYSKGYRDGYKVGYSEGESDKMAEIGEIELIDDIGEVLEAMP